MPSREQQEFDEARYNKALENAGFNPAPEGGFVTPNPQAEPQLSQSSMFPTDFLVENAARMGAAPIASSATAVLHGAKVEKLSHLVDHSSMLQNAVKNGAMEAELAEKVGRTAGRVATTATVLVNTGIQAYEAHKQLEDANKTV